MKEPLEVNPYTSTGGGDGYLPSKGELDGHQQDPQHLFFIPE